MKQKNKSSKIDRAQALAHNLRQNLLKRKDQQKGREKLASTKSQESGQNEKTDS